MAAFPRPPRFVACSTLTRRPALVGADAARLRGG